MAQKILENLAISAFCENMAMMLAAGIGADEAAGLLCEDSAGSLFHDAAAAVQKELLLGASLAGALQKSGQFPDYVCKMIAAGEKAGRTEQVLRSLAAHYKAQHELHQKLRSAVLYPAVLLVLMAGILAFLLAAVLPVFTGVYQSLSGDLSASSYGYIRIAGIVGWAALVVTAVLAVCLLAGGLCARSAAGRAALARLFERLPFTRRAAVQLAQAHFTEVLSIFIASGVDVDSAMEAASSVVAHGALSQKVSACRAEMAGGAGLATAVFNQKLFEPLYGRMLVSAARSGQLEPALAKLAAELDAEAQTGIDSLTDSVEPALSAFLTVAVGVTLLCVMLPLIGILGSIG